MRLAIAYVPRDRDVLGLDMVEETHLPEVRQKWLAAVVAVGDDAQQIAARPQLSQRRQGVWEEHTRGDGAYAQRFENARAEKRIGRCNAQRVQGVRGDIREVRLSIINDLVPMPDLVAYHPAPRRA